MKVYDLEDPVDLQRFKLNLMCGDVVDTINDHVQGHRIGVLPPDLTEKFTTLANAIKDLENATLPGGKPETGGVIWTSMLGKS